jgi:hypothetical protein
LFVPGPRLSPGTCLTQATCRLPDCVHSSSLKKATSPTGNTLEGKRGISRMMRTLSHAVDGNVWSTVGGRPKWETTTGRGKDAISEPNNPDMNRGT